MILSKPLVSALTFYLTQLFMHPVRTKAITCSVIATAGNYASQVISGNKVINNRSVLAYAVYGLLFGGTVPHYFYAILDRIVARDASFAIAKKLFIERLIYSPLFQAFSLYIVARLEGKSHQAALDQLQKLYWTVLKSSWKYMTVIQLLNLSLVPPFLRVLILNLVAFFWVIYVANKRRQLQAKSGNSQK